MEKLKYSKIRSLIDFYKRKKDFKSPSGLEIDFGPRGCGKTTIIAKYYYQFNNGKLPYTNFYSNVSLHYYDSINNSTCHYLDLNNHKLTDYLNPDDNLVCKYKLSTYDTNNPVEFFIEHNSIICLDELGILHMSRDFKNFPKELIKFIKLLRHFGIYIIGNSQNYDVDLALKNASNDLRLSQKILNFSISRKIKKYPGLIKATEQSQVSADNIGDIVEFASIFEKDSIRITYIPFYTNLFDSFG